MDQKHLPSGSQARVLRALTRCGAVVLPPDRGKGAHRVVHLNGRVSMVQSGEITKGMVKTILTQLDLDAVEFRKAW